MAARSPSYQILAVRAAKFTKMVALTVQHLFDTGKKFKFYSFVKYICMISCAVVWTDNIPVGKYVFIVKFKQVFEHRDFRFFNATLEQNSDFS